jgi:hypothetical protein
MFAKCVSRTFVAFVIAFALVALPAAGALAATSVPGEAAPTDWWGGVEQWFVDWTQDVLGSLRLRPQAEGEADDPQVVAAPLPGDEGVRHLEADDGANFDPDG